MSLGSFKLLGTDVRFVKTNDDFSFNIDLNASDDHYVEFSYKELMKDARAHLSQSTPHSADSNTSASGFFEKSGFGYDTDDSFIDDEIPHDECCPPIEREGFFINAGKLLLKESSPKKKNLAKKRSKKISSPVARNEAPLEIDIRSPSPSPLPTKACHKDLSEIPSVAVENDTGSKIDGKIPFQSAKPLHIFSDCYKKQWKTRVSSPTAPKVMKKRKKSNTSNVELQKAKKKYKVLPEGSQTSVETDADPLKLKVRKAPKSKVKRLKKKLPAPVCGETLVKCMMNEFSISSQVQIAKDPLSGKHIKIDSLSTGTNFEPVSFSDCFLPLTKQLQCNNKENVLVSKKPEIKNFVPLVSCVGNSFLQDSQMKDGTDRNPMKRRDWHWRNRLETFALSSKIAPSSENSSILNKKKVKKVKSVDKMLLGTVRLANAAPDFSCFQLEHVKGDPADPVKLSKEDRVALLKLKKVIEHSSCSARTRINQAIGQLLLQFNNSISRLSDCHIETLLGLIASSLLHCRVSKVKNKIEKQKYDNAEKEVSIAFKKLNDSVKLIMLTLVKDVQSDINANDQTAPKDDKMDVGPFAPKKVFPWSPVIHENLGALVHAKVHCYNVAKNNVVDIKQYLEHFLKENVLKIWPEGLMNLNTLTEKTKEFY